MMDKDIDNELGTYNELMRRMYIEGVISTKLSVTFNAQQGKLLFKTGVKERCFPLSQTGIDQVDRQYSVVLKELQIYGGFDLVEHLRELII